MKTSSPSKELELFEFAAGRKAGWGTLRRLLPDVATALFFAKAMSMDYKKLSKLLYTLFKTNVVIELASGAHSTSLQDYIVDTVPPDVWPEGKAPTFDNTIVPKGDILPELWDNIDITIAASIKAVAEKLSTVLDRLPGKAGDMTFTHMARLNKRRPTIGDYKASISHKPVADTLVILDVSGSMSSHTIQQIVDDVVALSYKANASLAIVSNSTRLWEPATYGTADILREAEYGGTHYETLTPLFTGRDWDVVVTIADYDSSYSAGAHFRQYATGRIGKVLDISLVNRPTYLAEVVGQIADEVEPVLVATSQYVVT